MRKRKNAFTLIELLAVIVILAIISLIATPIILGIVEDAKKDAFLRSVELLVGTTDIDITNKTFEEEYTYTITDGDISNLEVGVKNTTGMNGNITYDINGNESYAIHNGVYCVIKTDNNTEVSDYEEGKCIIPPVLTESDISFITFNDLEYIYDGTEKEIVVNNLSAEFSVTYVNNKGTNVGNYNATAIITGKNHRGSITKEATLTIQKASLTLKAEDKTSKQGEEIEELTYQVVSGTIYGNDELNINLTKEDGTEIGTYNIFVNAENTNYEIILVNGIYTITVGFTSESCFAFSNGSIRNYYDYEGNNSSNKACPRDVIIPETINGVIVTSIGYAAFKEKNITSVQFPSDLKSIEGYAFSICNIQGELDLSNTRVTSIGKFAFIGESDGSTNQITSVKFPSSLESIGWNAFSGNALSGELDLSDTVISNIQRAAFAGNSDGSTNQITSVKFPNTLEKIETNSFGGNILCGELDLSNTKVTTIEASAFIGKSDGSTNQITSVKFPSTLESIGSSAFAYNNLSGELDLSNIKITSIGYDAFTGSYDGSTNQITSIKLPFNVEKIESGAFAHNAFSDELDLSMYTNLTSIGGSAFAGSSDGSTNQITSVKLPNSLTSIGSHAFQYTKLSGELDLSYLTNLTSIDGGAFQGSDDGSTNQITSIKFPSTLESIGQYAFHNNNLVGELDLSNTRVTSIEMHAFKGKSDGSTNQITSVKFPNTLINIEKYAFQYNPLTSVTFYGRSDLTGVTIDFGAFGSFNTANITFITE